MIFNNMDGFTRDQKMAMLVVPILLFGVLGVSYDSATRRQLTLEEEGAMNSAQSISVSNEHVGHANTLLKKAIELKSYALFVEALRETPYHDSASQEVFGTLIDVYSLHKEGNHAGADARLLRSLYGEELT